MSSVQNEVDVQRLASEIAPPHLRQSLLDRLAEPIEEATHGVSSLLTTLIRQGLRSGIQKLDDGLDDSVRQRVDEEVDRRGPTMEETTRTIALQIASEAMERLTAKSKETANRLKERMDQLEEELASERQQRVELQTAIQDQIDQMRRNHAEELTTTVQELESKVQDFAKQSAHAFDRLDELHGVLRQDLEQLTATQQATTDEWTKQRAELQQDFFKRLQNLQTQWQQQQKNQQQEFNQHFTQLQTLLKKMHEADKGLRERVRRCEANESAQADRLLAIEEELNTSFWTKLTRRFRRS